MGTLHLRGPGVGTSLQRLLWLPSRNAPVPHYAALLVARATVLLMSPVLKQRRSTAGVLAFLLGAAFVPTALASSVPSQPLSLRVSGGVTQNAVTLEWAQPASLSGVTGVSYDVFRNGTKAASTSTTRLTVGSLAAGTSYSFSVRACTKNGCGSQSAAINVKTLPATPTGVAATPGNAQVQLSWRSVIGADGYRVWYRTSTAATFSEWAPGAPDSSPAAVTGLLNGAPYVFKVQAYNASGSVESATILATPQTVPNTPNAPERVYVSGTQNAIRWVRPADGGSALRGYEIWVDGALRLKTGPAVITYTLAVPLNTQAMVQLKACNVLGCSALSEPLWAGTAPNPPTNVQAVGGTKTVTVSWTPSTSVGVLSHRVSYRVYGSTRDADWIEWTPGVSDVSPLTISNLDANTRYEVRVSAHRSVGFTHSVSRNALTSPSPPATTTTTTTPPSTTTPPGNITPPQIAAGESHTCALTSMGAVKCWGSNAYGLLGDGTTTNRSTPVQVSGLTSGVVQITVGSTHSCALMVTGVVRCWGWNSAGQLGDGTTTNRSTPVQVSGLPSGVTQIAAGSSYSCALLATGSARCWGYNGTGGLGDGTTTDRLTPVQVSGLAATAAQLSAATSRFTCALLVGGDVKCWGWNPSGQLGDGTTTDRLTPVQVAGLTAGVQQISTGAFHSCVVVASAVKCWGNNSRGQLGTGNLGHGFTPLQVPGLTSGAQQVSAGGGHTCALLVAGLLKCWGENLKGQLGDGTTTDRLTPVQVSGFTSNIAQVSAGRDYTCVALSSGAVRCWGNNSRGQLGDGTTTDRLTPVDVVGLNLRS